MHKKRTLASKSFGAISIWLVGVSAGAPPVLDPIPGPLTVPDTSLQALIDPDTKAESGEVVSYVDESGDEIVETWINGSLTIFRVRTREGRTYSLVDSDNDGWLDTLNGQGPIRDSYLNKLKWRGDR
jgi:hypothetical protein